MITKEQNVAIRKGQKMNHIHNPTDILNTAYNWSSQYSLQLK